MTMAAAGIAPLLRGDPAAIRDSAGRWRRIGDECGHWADEVRGCRVAGFQGDEAADFDSAIERSGRDLDAASAAWWAGSRALLRYADDLEACQSRLAGLAAEMANHLGGADERWRAVGPERPVADSLAARAAPVLADHDGAVRRCGNELHAARALLPTVAARPRTTLTGPTPYCSGALTPMRWAAPSGRNTSAAPARTGIQAISGALRVAAGQSALMGRVVSAPHPADLHGFFSELADLLSTAALALAVIGGGGASGLAIAGGVGAVGGGVAAAVAPEAAAVAGAAAAGFGLAILVASVVEGESPGQELDEALDGNKIRGTPEVNPHDLAELNRSRIPPDLLKEVDDAIARAKAGKKRFPGHDGETWKNEWGQLPEEPKGYYTEWTAAPNGAGRGWDQRWRVIIGGDTANPDAIYLWDHSPGPLLCIGP